MQALLAKPQCTGRIVVVLGSPNDQTGKLSSLALARVELASRLYREAGSLRIILTGGFGQHFNSSTEPHWAHLERHLVHAGVSQDAIIGRIDSANTFEDVTMLVKVLDTVQASTVILVTSDFHTPRVFLLASIHLHRPFVVYGAKTIGENNLADLERHESLRISELLMTLESPYTTEYALSWVNDTTARADDEQVGHRHAC